MRLAAVADPVLARCEGVAPDLPHFPSADDLLAAADVDGIVLASPAAAHLQDARLASAAGVATLVEKPPAADVAEARAMAGLDPAPWLGLNRRFDPALQRLRASVPGSARVDVTLELHYRGGSWRPHVVEDDALLALGTHLVDLARWLTGREIERVRTVDIRPTSAELELELERGRARLSCATDRPLSEVVAVRGERGEPIARHSGAGILHRARRRLARPRTADSLVRLLTLQLEAFAAAARGGHAPLLATAADGVPVMATIDAARRSADRGGEWCSVAA